MNFLLINHNSKAARLSGQLELLLVWLSCLFFPPNKNKSCYLVVKVYQLIAVPRMALENTRARCCTIASSTKMRSVSQRENRTRNEKLHHQFNIDTTCILVLAEGSKGTCDSIAPLLHI